MAGEAPAQAGWYSRPVLVVADMVRSLAFYTDRLGFKQDWGSKQDGRPDVVQVSRDGCELILCAHWPERVGHSLQFISLHGAELSALRAELTAKGVALEDGWWGYDLTVVRDPDGNTLYFPHETAPQAAETGAPP